MHIEFSHENQINFLTPLEFSKNDYFKIRQKKLQRKPRKKN